MIIQGIRNINLYIKIKKDSGPYYFIYKIWAFIIRSYIILDTTLIILSVF